MLYGEPFMEFSDLVQALSERTGVELVVEDNSCSVAFDEMEVTMLELPELQTLCTYAEVGNPPPEKLEELLGAMLEANFQFRGTAGSTLSRDPETGSFFLCRYDALQMLDGDSFMQMLEKFVNTLETWRQLVENFRASLESGDVFDATESLKGGLNFSDVFIRV